MRVLNSIATPLTLAFLLLFHHAYIHDGMLFQWKDIDNHETWIIGLLGVALGMKISV